MSPESLLTRNSLSGRGLKTAFLFYSITAGFFQGLETSPEFLKLKAMIDNIQENYIEKENKLPTSICLVIWIVMCAVGWVTAFGIVYAIKVAIGVE